MTELVERGANQGQLLQDINLIAETLDRLHADVAGRSAEDRLRAYRALGQIAGGLLDLQELSAAQPELTDYSSPDEFSSAPDPLDSELEDLLGRAESQSAVTVEPTGLVIDLKPVHLEPVALPDTEHITTPEASTISRTELSPVDQLRQHFSELKLSNREAQLLLNLCAKSGQPARAADLYGGLEGASGGLKQATSKFIRTLKDSVYGEHLIITGAKGGTRYLWQGHGFNLEAGAVVHEADQAVPVSIDIPETVAYEFAEEEVEIDHEVPEAAVVDVRAALKAHGITLDEDDASSLSVHGVPLRISAMAAQVVKEIAARGGKTTFRELVQSEAIQLLGSKNVARDLNEALLSIATALQTHDIAWRDVQTHIDGTKKRTLELGGSAPSPLTVGRSAMSLTLGQNHR